LQRPFLYNPTVGGDVEKELLMQLEKLSPITLLLILGIFAIVKLPRYSLAKMKLEHDEKEKILVHLNEQVDKLTIQLDQMKKELLDYRKRFFKLEDDYAQLKNEYEELKGELENHEKETKR
jgi:peptidoglycan hydrolase CwlO-like protein